jgi:hypothetical protein
MKLTLLLSSLFLFGCDPIKVKDKSKDWKEIYKQEMLKARENQDRDAYFFFLKEYEKEFEKPAVNKNTID